MVVWISFLLIQNIFRLIDLNFHGCVEHTLEWASLQFAEFLNRNPFVHVPILMVELKVIKFSHALLNVISFPGIVAPYIESVDQVKMLVGAVKLRPLKVRIFILNDDP